MKKTFKRIVSFLLVAVMVSGVFTSGITSEMLLVNASATESLTEGIYTYTVENNEATITDVDDSISGDIVIPSTLGGYPVTSIGNHAFYGCNNLATVTIGNSVTSIGACVFHYCSSLTSITVDSANTAYSSDEYGVLFNKDKTVLIQYPIGNARTSYVIPDNVTSICYVAFDFCTALTSITIPDSVTSIGEGAFDCCDSLVINIDPDNITYSTDKHGVLFNKDKTVLVQYFNKRTETDYAIPDGIISIGDYAFYNSTKLTNVTIPKSVTSIGNYAFSKNYFTNIIIPDSVTSIGDYAFEECGSVANAPGLTSIIIPDSITHIGEGVFSTCCMLENITLPDTLKSIGNGAFHSCSSLKNITIPNSVTTIGNYAFGECDNLTSITIPDGVTIIGDSAFEGCESLTEAIISDSVTSIGEYAFCDCSNLTSVIINATDTGCHTFDQCFNLTNVVLGDNVTSIGEWSFTDCSNLTSITIPDNVTSIGRGAFYNSGLTSVMIPDSVTSIDYHAFSDCFAITNITVDSANTTYSSDEYGILFNNDKTKLIQYPIGNTRTNYVIPDSVTSIADYAFTDCFNLTSITIPDSVSNIYNFAFYDCTNLTDVYYSGTSEQWNSIAIYKYNDSLIAAQIHFNDVAPQKVVFDYGYKTVEIPVTPGDKIIPPEVPVREGYSFVGWTPEIPATMPAKDLTVTAMWTPNDYSLVYRANGGTFSDGTNIKEHMIPYGTVQAEWDVPETPSRPGYTWDGWDMATAPETMPAQQVNILGNWIQENYTVIFGDSLSDGVYSEETFAYGDSLSIPEVEKEGYTFLYWTDTEGNKVTPMAIMEDLGENGASITYKAVWEANTYDAVFMVDGVIYETVPTKFNEEIIAPTAPEKEGYTFGGWTPAVDMMDDINGKTFTAVWTVNKYKVTFMFKDKIYAEFFVNYNESINLPDTSNIEGYEFVCWLDENGNIADIPSEMPAKDLVYHMEYLALRQNSEYGVTVTYDKNCFDKEVDLKVSETIGEREKGSVYIVDEAQATYIGLYNIKLVYNESETTVKIPNGYKVKVMMPIPEKYVGNTFFKIVHHFDKGGREYLSTDTSEPAKKIEISEDGRYLIFYVSSFSLFEVFVIESDMPTLKIRNNPGTATINYGDVLSLTAETANMTEDMQVVWYVNGERKATGNTFKSEFKKDSEITAKITDLDGNVLVDENGSEISDSQKVTVKDNLWLRIVSFFKNLFRIDRVVIQSLFKGVN